MSGEDRESVFDTGDVKSIRRKRTDVATSLRKKHRNEELNRLRSLRSVSPFSVISIAFPSSEGTCRSEVSSSAAISNEDTLSSILTQIRNFSTTPDEQASFPPDPQSLMALLSSPDPSARLCGTTALRRVLARSESYALLDEIISLGIVPLVVASLKETSLPQLQMEATCVITNLASGQTRQVRHLVGAGAIEALVEVLKCDDWSLKGQALWALGNIGADCADFRDAVLQAGVLSYLLKMMEIAFSDPSRETFMKNAAWTLSMLLRGSPPPNVEFVSAAFPVLSSLFNYHDQETAVDCLWAAVYAANGKAGACEALVDAGTAAALITVLHEAGDNTVRAAPALQALGNIIACVDEKYCGVLLTQEIVPVLLERAQGSKKVLRRDALWALSNLCAGTDAQIRVLCSSGVLSVLFTVLEETGDTDMRKEAAWGVINTCVSVEIQTLAMMAKEREFVRALVRALSINDTSVILQCLAAVHRLLECGISSSNTESSSYRDSPVTKLFEEEGGAERLEELQDHVNEDVFHKASEILSSFFDVDDAMDERGNNGSMFAPAPFGFSVQQQQSNNTGSDFGCAIAGAGPLPSVSFF